MEVLVVAGGCVVTRAADLELHGLLGNVAGLPVVALLGLFDGDGLPAGIEHVVEVLRRALIYSYCI